MKGTYKMTVMLVVSMLMLFVNDWNGMSGPGLYSAPLTEDDAIASMATDICKKADILKGKKLSVLYFQNLEGKEVPEGRRFSDKLVQKLMTCGSFSFVERSGISDLIKAQEFELSGLVENEGGEKDTGSMLSADVLITGTIAQRDPGGELSVKAADVRTGEIYAVSTARFVPGEKFSYREDEKTLSLYEKDPDLLQKINETYRLAMLLSENRPGIFLLVMAEKNDPDLAKKPGLERRMRRIEARSEKQNPEKYKKLLRLRRGVRLIRENDPVKYEELVRKKRVVMDSM